MNPNLPDLSTLAQWPTVIVLGLCAFAGLTLKGIPTFRNWLIPFVVGGFGGIVGWCLLSPDFNGLLLGILLGGISVYGHQLVTQFINRYPPEEAGRNARTYTEEEAGRNARTSASAPILLACLLPLFLTGCATAPQGTPKPTIAETVQGAEAWIEANILPGLPGLVAGGVVIAGRELIKDDVQRQEIAWEVYAVAACVRSLMGGALPDSAALRAAIESAGGGGPLLDLTAIADMVGGFVDPYLKQVQGDPNARFAVKFLEAIASGFEKGAALLLKGK